MSVWIYTFSPKRGPEMSLANDNFSVLAKVLALEEGLCWPAEIKKAIAGVTPEHVNAVLAKQSLTKLDAQDIQDYINDLSKLAEFAAAEGVPISFG
jgi:hypothetical protein